MLETKKEIITTDNENQKEFIEDEWQSGLNETIESNHEDLTQTIRITESFNCFKNQIQIGKKPATRN